jgi:hypothetical protein
VEIPNASGPKVLSATEILMAQNTPGQPGDGAILRYVLGTPATAVSEFRAPGFETWDCRNGRFVGYAKGNAGRLYRPQISDTGHVTDGVDRDGSTILRIDGQAIDSGPIYDWRWAAGADVLAWTKVAGGLRVQRWCRAGDPPTAVRDAVRVTDDEGEPIPIVLSDGRVLLVTHTNEPARLFVRPFDSVIGWPIWNGPTFEPDAALTNATTLRAVWSAGDALGDVVIDLAAPPRDLRLPVPPPPPPPEDEMEKPGVNFGTTFPLTLRSGQPLEFRTYDRNNPTHTDVIVTLEPKGPNEWAVRVRMTNAKDTDRSGDSRRVRYQP